jgi:Abortive infection alpha
MSPVPHAVVGKAIVTATKAPTQPDELDPQAARFAEQITGTARGELGAWMADHIRLKRMRSQLKILTKADEFARTAGFEPKIVNLKMLVPLLEAGSLEEEDDEDMARQWAALLANASRRDAEPDTRPSFVAVLSTLTPTEAKILDYLYRDADTVSRDKWNSYGPVVEQARDLLHIDPRPFEVAVENPIRQRLLVWPSLALGGDDTMRVQTATSDFICRTEFGYDFVTACQPPTPGAGVTPNSA